VSDSDKTAFRRQAVAIGAVLACAAVTIELIRWVTSGEVMPKKVVPDVVTLRVLPPPPPPPPPEQPPEPKMVEQPKMREPEVKPDKPIERPKDAPPKPLNTDAPPAPLALDAKGEGPADAFGLAGRPGGGDFLGGGGGGGTRYGWYASMVQQQIQDTLHKNDKLRTARYRVAVRLWLSRAGTPSRVELVGSTGQSALDDQIKDALLAMPKLAEAPPQDMPEPIVLRIDARNAQG